MIENGEDLYLMFLPSFSLETPLHYLLANEEYELFNKLTESIKKSFESFINSDTYINKIVDMLIYILEHVSLYRWGALEEIYCKLPFYVSCDYDSEDENENYVNIYENVSTIEMFLNKIRVKIEENKVYASCEFNL